MIICNRCAGTGWLNFDQALGINPYDLDAMIEWVNTQTSAHDVQICDCCGDGSTWFGEPGHHYSIDDPQGPSGPYAYNGGLCECH